MIRYYFIVNPTSGSGKGKKVWQKIEKYLLGEVISYQVCFTNYPGHGTGLARQLAEKIDKVEQTIIVAVGGDGTIHEVVNGVKEFPGIIIGYIPAGSGNDFSRGFSIPAKPLDALKKILTYSPTEEVFDIGKYEFQNNERVFTSSIGIGFDALVADVSNKSTYKKIMNKFGLGFLAYVISVFRLLFFFAPFHAEIQLDDKVMKFQNVWLLAITNIPFYGGGMKINPQSSPIDGELNMCIVNNLSRWKLLFLFLTVFTGSHTKLKEVTLLSGEKISVQTSYSVPFHADGEVNGSTPIQIIIDKKSRQFI